MATSLTQLIQIVEFVFIGPGATETLPHNINVNNVPQTPDFVAADVGDLTIVVDETTVTVTNNGPLQSAPNIWLELKHTIQRAFGADQTTSLFPRPFIVAAAGSTGGGDAWTRTGTVIHETIPTDQVVVGAPAPVGAGPFEVQISPFRYVQIGSQDSLGHFQIWCALFNSILRMGASIVDGDSLNIDSDGFIIYHPTGDLKSVLQADKLALTRFHDATLNYFKADQTGLSVKDIATSLLNLFNVDQATLNTFIGDPANPISHLFINQAAADHGSSADMQVSSLVANAPSLRCNQYGNNTGIPGLSTIKSRGATIGALAAVLPGDVLLRLTAVGVPNDGVSVPLAGLVSLQVPAGGVGVNYVATDFEIQLVPLTGPINGRKQAFLVDSEGVLHIKEAGPAAAPTSHMAGLAVTGVGGTIVVPNSRVTATSKFTLSIQDGGAAPTNGLYVSARVIGTSFTIQMINPADVGVQVYYQLWEPTIP